MNLYYQYYLYIDNVNLICFFKISFKKRKKNFNDFVVIYLKINRKGHVVSNGALILIHIDTRYWSRCRPFRVHRTSSPDYRDGDQIAGNYRQWIKQLANVTLFNDLITMGKFDRVAKKKLRNFTWIELLVVIL